MIVPELGPALGHLTAQPDAAPGGRWVRLDDLRLELVSRLFELAGTAREFAASGDRAAAAAALGRATWLAEWERVVAEATARFVKAVEARLAAAAAEARLPRKRRALLALSEADRRAIAGRLGGGAVPFLQSLETLERTVPPVSASGARGEAAEPEWQEAMLAAARRLDSAWLALEAAARAEQSLWAAEVARVRAWRRPTRPLWVASAVVILVALYLGLVLGGYFAVPGPLRPLAEAWWSRLP